MTPRGYFDVDEINVKAGVIGAPRLPRSVFFKADKPIAGRDLFVFLGEAQPSTGSFAFAHEITRRATEFGVGRIFTFAAMATQLHPSADARVFCAATTHDTLADLKRLEIQPIEDGQVGGMNGVLLGAAAEEGMEGICLLGEMPYFAAQVPNPKAAKVVLESFASLAGLELDLSELAEQAEAVDHALIELLEKSKAAQAEGEGPALPEAPSEEAEAAEPGTPPAPKPLDLATRNRIERLFEEARRDRLKAMKLKEELDRLRVFDQYEDRFLDLFRRAD